MSSRSRAVLDRWTGLKELPTCFGDVYLVQGVCKRFHQVASKQSEKAFQLLSNAVGQVVKCQQPVPWGIFCLGPVIQLQPGENSERTSTHPAAHSKQEMQGRRPHLEEERPECDLRELHHHGHQTVNDPAFRFPNFLQIILKVKELIRQHGRSTLVRTNAARLIWIWLLHRQGDDSFRAWGWGPAHL